ncbi:MAG: hypothetical protein ACREQJ_03870 [Candidatus Binatia bacterium]
MMRAITLAAILVLSLGGPAFPEETVLAANSVHTKFPGGWYDELHVFPVWAREFSDRTLYGYSMREDVGVAVRNYRVMRLKSPSAYLWTSDLFAGAELRTTSNTILFLFPRDPGIGPFLYRVLEEPGALLRLEGPGGAALGFDARTHRVRGTLGFTLEPPIGIGIPPRISPRSLHLKLESAGQSPFLRGATARFVDVDGSVCSLTTDELFRFEPDDPEADVLRFDTDDALFSFLATRCPDLRLPPLSTEIRRAQQELVRRAAVAAEEAKRIPTPAPTPRPTSQFLQPMPTRRPGEHGPEDGGIFEWLF